MPAASQSGSSQGYLPVSAPYPTGVGAASQVLAALASGPAASAAGGEALKLSIDQLNDALPDSRMVTMIAQAAAIPSRTGPLEARDPDRARQSALKLMGRYRQERHAAVASVLAAAAASPPTAAASAAAGAASIPSTPRPAAAAGGYGYGGAGGFAAHSKPLTGYGSGGGAGPAMMGPGGGGAGAPLPTATTADILRAVVRQDEARHREIGCETVRHAACSGTGSHRLEALPGTRWSLERLQAYVTHVKVSQGASMPLSVTMPCLYVATVLHATRRLAAAGDSAPCAFGGRIASGRPLLCATAATGGAPGGAHNDAPAGFTYPSHASACAADVPKGRPHPGRRLCGAAG